MSWEQKRLMIQAVFGVPGIHDKAQHKNFLSHIPGVRPMWYAVMDAHGFFYSLFYAQLIWQIKKEDYKIE